MSAPPSHRDQILASLKVIGNHTKRTYTAKSRSRRRITGFIQQPKRGFPVTPSQIEISPYPHVSTALIGPSTAAVEQGVSFTLPRPGGVKVVPQPRSPVEGDTLWNTQWNSRRCSDLMNCMMVETMKGVKWPTRNVSFADQPIIIPTSEIEDSEFDKSVLDAGLKIGCTS